MNLTRNRIQSIGWAFVLTICMALTVALTLRVNAVKGQVRQTENHIVAVERDIQFLEVEFQTRANQQQLAALNSVEFGYVAPGAGQYIEGERQLAALGAPRAPGMPSPIRMAHAVTETEAMPFVAMVNPMTGKPQGSPTQSDAAPTGGNAIGAAIAHADGTSQPERVKLARAAED